MDRRLFLRRAAIALAGGLIVGDAALEAMERLTHVRKSFPVAGIQPTPMTASEIIGRRDEMSRRIHERMMAIYNVPSRPSIWYMNRSVYETFKEQALI